MQIKIFTIPVPGGEGLVEDMNKFLRSKKILQTENHIVNNGTGIFWCFCVKYLDDIYSTSKTKTDYREILDEESFKRFARMREIRKKLAQDEDVPAFTILTDEEMAELARMAEITPGTMRTVKGIGEKKVERYGKYFFTKTGHEKSE